MTKVSSSSKIFLTFSTFHGVLFGMPNKIMLNAQERLKKAQEILLANH